jgi:RNA polymerase sigma factor (sigma-70 family)
MATGAGQWLEQLCRLLVVPDADGVLLERFVGGRDETAFAALVARHGPMVWRVCRRVLGNAHTAEDAFQATLLVLARQAKSIRQPATLAAWLHAVAYRVASKARTTEAQRRTAELADNNSLADPHQADPLTQMTAREWLTAVDEELQRLPRTYRLPVILCCLEGQTQQEAAQILGWTPASVKGRLERGRKQLHARLLRRGLTLSAGLAAVEAASSAGSATPATGASIHAILELAAGNPAYKGAIPARILDLTKGVHRPMLVTKVTIGVAVALAALLALVSGGLLAQHTPAEGTHAAPTKPLPPTEQARVQQRDEAKAAVPQKEKPPIAGPTYDVTADAVQPAGSPLLLTITLTNNGKEPIPWWCGGPAMDYPGVSGLKAQLTDAAGMVRESQLSNGQYTAGSGLVRTIAPGASVAIPALLPPQAKGTYVIQIGKDKSARVSVQDNPELLKKRELDLLARARKKEPFAQHAIAAHLSKTLERQLFEDLFAEDRAVALQSAYTLSKVEKLPAASVPLLTKAMTRQLEQELGRQDRKTDVLIYMVSMAARIGTDEAMEPLLVLAKSDMGGGARAQAVAWLGYFTQERVTKELYRFLKDADADVRFEAARALANRKDAAGIDILIAAASDAKNPMREQACRALVNFPNEPRAERAIQSRLDDADPTVRDGAKMCLEQLRQAKKK